MAEVEIKYGNFNFKGKDGYPTPKVSFDLSKSRTSAGDFLTSERTVTLEGICYVKRKAELDDDPSPSTSQDDDTINGLFEAASNLKEQILINNYKSLIVQCNGAPPLVSDSVAIVDSIVFSENQNNWADTIDYTIIFKIPVSGSGSQLINDSRGSFVESVTDNYVLESLFDNQFWDRNENVPVPTYKISRTIGAVGINIGSSNGSLYWAKKWVNDRDNYATLTGMFPPGTFTLYNQERSVDVSEINGSYQITDTFIAKSGNDAWLDTFKATVSLDKQYKITIDMDGTIQGLEPATGIYAAFVNYADPPIGPIGVSGQNDIKNPVSGFFGAGYGANDGVVDSYRATTKYRNAVSGWKIIEPLLINRASGYLEQARNMIPLRFRNNFNSVSLNDFPISTSEQLFPYDGKITYNRKFDTRPKPLITGTLVETLSIEDTLPVIRYQETKVIGRRLGPVVYGFTNSFSVGSRTLNYVGTFPMATGLAKYSFPNNILKDINAKISGYKPTPTLLGLPSASYNVYVKSENQDIDINTNTFSYNITWEYSAC
jgi:hypothetical protein